jgi:hypothetical protein
VRFIFSFFFLFFLFFFFLSLSSTRQVAVARDGPGASLAELLRRAQAGTDRLRALTARQIWSPEPPPPHQPLVDADAPEQVDYRARYVSVFGPTSLAGARTSVASFGRALPIEQLRRQTDAR